MADTFELEVATPERLVIREQVTEAEIPAKDGAIGVLPEHAPLMSELGTGALHYSVSGGARQVLMVSGGWVEVLNNHVRVLADRAEKSNEIDVARAEAALQRANERLAGPVGDLDVASTLEAMKRAQARIEAARISSK
ncbi:MAG TPA: F0F1 ATP synthase subunit epsilon [Bryobacteraceae bacterium]|nr:F0F1 ATP synthase subunit epsilon [Bryobacteraceae bacterium]